MSSTKWITLAGGGKVKYETIIETSSPNLDLIPSHIDLVASEIELVDKKDREYMLKTILAEIQNDYDFIIIDCAPSLGLITLNALVSSDAVIIPIQCEIIIH